MCGRYISPDQAALERYWNLSSSGVQWSASYNVCPSQELPVLRLDEHGIRDLSVLEWGFQPAWAKKSWINARSETVFTSRIGISILHAESILREVGSDYRRSGPAALLKSGDNVTTCQNLYMVTTENRWLSTMPPLIWAEKAFFRRSGPSTIFKFCTW